MQDEVNTKVVAIMIKGGKISAEVLKKALDKFVQEIEKAQKQMQQPKTYRGKQSIKHLMSQNAAISNIEVTDGNIKSFERTASKYGLDFALKKDVSVEPPSYLVFFKGRDVDVMTAAFKEFSAKTVKQKEQPSIRHKLDQEKAQSKAQHKEKVKVKTKDRGVEPVSYTHLTELSGLKTELPDKWEYYIDRLSCHIASTGKQYHSHAATIYKWAQEDAAKGKAAPKQGIPDYSCKEGESL